MTGAANGIGRALAHRLAGLGYELLLVDVDGAGLESLADELPNMAWTVLADLSGHLGVEQVCEAIGKLDRPAALINNAGMYRGNPLHTYDVPMIERRLLGQCAGSDAAHPGLRQPAGRTPRTRLRGQPLLDRG